MRDSKNTKSPVGRRNSDDRLSQAVAPFFTHEEMVRMIDLAIRRAEWPSPPKPRVLSPWEQIHEHMMKKMRESLNSDFILGKSHSAPDKKGG